MWGEHNSEKNINTVIQSVSINDYHEHLFSILKYLYVQCGVSTLRYVYEYRSWS